MVVGEVATATDVVVIGAGPGGYVAALRCASKGLRTTLVERDRIGGTCLNVGCIPSKLLTRSRARLVDAARRNPMPGVALSVSIDMGELQDHIAATVGRLVGGVGQLLDAAGVQVVTGAARFVRGGRLVVVDGSTAQHIEFDRAVVATGSRPVELPGLPIDHRHVLDSSDVLTLEHVPRTAVVVGAGYIGVELGTALAKLGSRVTIVEATPRVLPALPQALGATVARHLGHLGVEVLLRTTAESRADDGVVVSGPTGSRTIAAEIVVVAVGRAPNTEDLADSMSSASRPTRPGEWS